MKTFVAGAGVALALLFPAQTWGGANCKAYPKAEWMSEVDAKAKIEGQGYKIAKFKVDGNCYEIYGTNQAGKKVEIYFDAKSLDIVKSEIEK
jgi:hypothetical protein